jgi:membrane fusion protein, copper/silver efflux system
VSAPDTELPAPRALWIMGLVRWALVVAATSLATATWLHFWTPVASHTSRAGYFCPMHPEVHADAPGECPICHMQLERVGAQAPATTPDSGPPPDGSAPASLMLTLDRVQLGGIASEALRPRASAAVLRAPAVVVAAEDRVAQVRVRANSFVERVAVQQTGVAVGAGEVLAWVFSPQVLQAQQEWIAAMGWTGAMTDERLASRAREGLLLLGVDPRELAVIERTRVPLRAVPLRSPMRGVVMRREAVLGMYATPETLLYEVAALDRVWATASVDVRDLPRVRRGTPATLRLEGATREASVTWVEPVASLETRTARVRVELANPDGALRPGAVGTLELRATQPEGGDSLRVPRDAVIDTGAAQYVFVDRGGGVFEPRAVRLGDLDPDGYAVREGLRAGEAVVTRGAFLLDAESRLRATLSRAGGAP